MPPPTRSPLPPASAPPVLEPGPAFDWRLYRAGYADLASMATAADAAHHFLTIGQAEGRLATAAAVDAMRAALQAEHGPLPPNFVWHAYAAANPDLADLTSEADAILHYLREGRPAGRLHRRLDIDLYRSLHMPGSGAPPEAVVEHFRSVGQDGGFDATLEDIAAGLGVRSTAWLVRLDVAAFAADNAAWAGPVPDKRAAAAAMIREGIARLVPLAPGLIFDPAYYAEANPAVSRLVPEAAYRHWLFHGLPGDRPCNARDHLARHGLPGEAFPPGFDWARYRRRKGVRGDNPWALLDHLVAASDVPAGEIPVHAAGAHAFLAGLAAAITPRDAARGAALSADAARYPG